MKQIITPPVPTFYSFSGEIHKVIAWILDDSKYQAVLDAVNELGRFEKGEEELDYHSVITNPITPYEMEEILRGHFFAHDGTCEDLEIFAYYKKAIALGADLSLVASNEQEFMEFALKVANK